MKSRKPKTRASKRSRQASTRSRKPSATNMLSAAATTEVWAAALATGDVSAGAAKQLKRQDRDALRRVISGLAWSTDEATPPAAVSDQLLRSVERDESQQRAATNKLFASVRANEGKWNLLAPGVTYKTLFTHPTAGISTRLMRMVAGSTFPEHRHSGIEELYIIEGDCYCEGECLGPGDYHRAESGSIHGVTFTEHGCLMLVHTSPLQAATA